MEMPYDGDYTQEDYAQQMIDEYKEAGVHPKKVFAQSFNLDDVLYWIEREPMFGEQAVYLDGRYNVSFEDVRRVYLPAMRHRIIVNFEAQAENVESDQVLLELLEKVPEKEEV